MYNLEPLMTDSFFSILAQSAAIIIFAHFLLKKLLFEKRLSPPPKNVSPPANLYDQSQMIPALQANVPVVTQQTRSLPVYTTNMTDKLLDYADTMPLPVQSESSYRAAKDLDSLTDVPKAVKIPPPNDPHQLDENLNKLSADSVATLPTTEEDVMNGGVMFGNVTGFETNSSNFFDLTQIEDSNRSSAYINLTAA